MFLKNQNMKKVFALVIIATAFIGYSASAQRPAGGKMGLSKQELMDSLKVSEPIADSIVAVRNESMMQVRSIMSDQSLTQDQKKAKMEPVKQEMKAKLEKFLTREQMEKMKQMEMERRQKMGGEHNKGGSSSDAEQ
jgi:hypothetical protein